MQLRPNPDVAQQGIGRVDQRLRRRVVRAADDDRLAARAPQIVGRLVERIPIERRLVRLGHVEPAVLPRDAVEQRERDEALLRRRDRDAHVGVAAGQRHARLELNVARHQRA